MTTESILSKVKRHHHVRSHAKGKRANHESIEWGHEPAEVTKSIWQAPKFESQEVPRDWLERYQERQKTLAGIRL